MATFPTISSIAGQHILIYETFFKQVDLKGKGNIGAIQAANFLKKSELKESILSDIWDLADPQGRGFLDKQGFYVALKLIAVVQSGREVDAKYLTLDLPPPNFEPNTTKTTISNLITNNTPKITNVTNDVKKDKSLDGEWGIPLTERLKYDQIFDTLNPVDGLIPGNKVKPILLNSKLPVDVLGQVWDLSDIDGDGSLDREEFSVAMNLVYKALQKIPVPSALPPEMVPPSKRKQKVALPSNPTIAAATTTTTPKILSSPPDKADKNAGENESTTEVKLSTLETKVQPSTSSPSSFGNSQPPPQTVGWVVTPQAKAQCDELFVKADTDKDGYVSGSEIKRIFIKSGLPQPVLAKIWSLCDTKNQGKLNKDQFALAMHLIQQKLKGVDVPNKLAPNMIPPSARRNSLGDNVPPPGTVYDMNTPGMKEIELLTADIERIKIVKQKSDAEKLALDETIKSFESDFISLQQEIDVVVEAVKQLNNQKNEAQKRLDELDNKKVQMEKAIKSNEDLKEKQQKKILDLKEQLSNKDNLNKTIEEDMKSKRQELNTMRQQEMDLEMKFEASYRRLVQLSKLLHGSQAQISQAENNIEKLTDCKKEITNSLHLYDRMMNNEITEQEALACGDLRVSSPTLNFDLSSFDAMSDMVQMSHEEMEEFQAKLSAIQSGEDYESEEKECAKNDEDVKEVDKMEGKQAEDETPWTDVPFAKTCATNDPFSIGFVTSDIAKSPINPDDPFGQGAFAPPGAKPARPSRPPQPKTGGGAPPPRSKSPLPPRPKSPAPPGRPVSPAVSPSRPPPPFKSHAPESVTNDDDSSFFSQIRGEEGSFSDGTNLTTSNELGFAGFSKDQFASDYDLK